jgi:hypothetical protein
MARIKLECPECCNDSTITTSCKEPVGFCPLCGVPVVVPAEDDDDDYDEDDDE